MIIWNSIYPGHRRGQLVFLRVLETHGEGTFWDAPSPGTGRTVSLIGQRRVHFHPQDPGPECLRPDLDDPRCLTNDPGPNGLRPSRLEEVVAVGTFTDKKKAGKLGGVAGPGTSRATSLGASAGIPQIPTQVPALAPALVPILKPILVPALVQA